MRKFEIFGGEVDFAKVPFSFNLLTSDSLLTMSNTTPYRTSLLSLYKNIMSLHRRKLPEQLRSVGDDYVRTEFQSMKKVKKAVFVEEYVDFSII